MPPKGKNDKKESGKAKKAENEAKKSEALAVAKEKKEAADWEDGSKTKKAKDLEKEAKKAADAAKKADVARLLAEEEAAASVVKPKGKPPAKKKGGLPPAGPGAIATASTPTDTGEEPVADGEQLKEEPTEFSATGIDDALDLLSIVTAKTDKASVGQAAAGVEQHPERRFKAAFEAYKEQELPELKKDRPGLRLNQYHEILYKQFQKSPDNPFNQQMAAYNATQEDKVEALRKQKEITTSRLAVRPN